MTSIIIIAGITVGVFLLTLLISKRNKIAADKFLILYLFFFTVSQTYFYLEELGKFQDSAWMLLGRGIYLLGGPLFFYYVYTLTTARRISRLIYVATLLPFATYALHFLYYYLIGFEGQQVHIENGLLYINDSLPLTWSVFIVLLIASDPFYLGWFYLLLSEHKKRSVQAVSNPDQLSLRWLRIVFYLWTSSIIIFLPTLIFSIGQHWFSSGWLSVLLHLDCLTFVFFLGFYGFRQSSTFVLTQVQALQNETQSPRYERSGLAREQAGEYHAKLLEYMIQFKPYLEGDLTAQQLAQRLDISSNHLSQVINQLEGRNFFDFINHYRVEEVKSKMMDQKNGHLTLLALGMESGFNSKSSFNMAFKKLTGITPSAYYRSLSGGK